MPVITLTTEWRDSDYYHGVIRGILARLAPNIPIIVNACNIPPFNIMHAAFVVRNTFHHYPPGSVHLLCVSTEAGSRSRQLVVKARGHYFVGTDNGIFSLIINDTPEAVLLLKSRGKDNDPELFAETAASLLSGSLNMSEGDNKQQIKELVPLRATIDSDAINGSVIFIDSYGNAITNITREIFERIFSKEPITVSVQSLRHKINQISINYNDEQVGELLARFNHLNLLEIAINGASLSDLYGLETGAIVRIVHDKSEKSGKGLF